MDRFTPLHTPFSSDTYSSNSNECVLIGVSPNSGKDLGDFYRFVYFLILVIVAISDF